MSNPNRNNSNQNSTQHQDGKEETGAAAMSFTSSTPAGFQAIATAYGDYTKRSFEDTRAFVEKLAGVKSFEKAIEIQTEFAKTAFETFVSESQKIGALYGDLSKQSYKPFASFVARTPPTSR
ncbi:MAG: phasin family protein [Xanthobacteraceae bacterium]|nr:phasin family protein [Xanthobacteraceae bacterium]